MMASQQMLEQQLVQVPLITLGSGPPLPSSAQRWPAAVYCQVQYIVDEGPALAFQPTLLAVDRQSHSVHEYYLTATCTRYQVVS